MIPAKRLAEIREWAGPVGSGYGKSPSDAEIIALVTAYDALRDFCTMQRNYDGTMRQDGYGAEFMAFRERAYRLFPETTK